jgi:uncharacterized protein
LFNPYLIIPFATWAIAQAIKFSFAAFKGKIDFKYLYASGGMPSVHSAVVSSLAMTTLLIDGVSSFQFGLSALLAGIVMYDSFGVRRASGDHAAALNMLIETLSRDKVRLPQPTVKLREILGHKPSEVAAGALLGALLACLFNIDRISGQLAFLSAFPRPLETKIYLAIFGVLVIIGIATRIFIHWKKPGSRILKEVAKRIFTKTQVIGWMGLLLGFAQYQQLPYLASRVWPNLLIITLIAWDAWLLNYYWRRIPQALELEAEAARRGKWLKFSKRKKKA